MSGTAEDNDLLVQVEDIGLGFVPRLADGVGSLVLDDEVAVLSEDTGMTHLITGSGAVIWQCLDGEGSVGEIVEDLAAAFGAPEELIRTDVLDMVRALGAMGMLAGVAVPKPAARERDPGLTVGTPLPEFALPDRTGATVTRDQLAGRRTLLVNWSPRCGWCDVLAPDLASSHQALRAAGVDLVLITQGGLEENDELLARHGMTPDRLLVLGGRPNSVFKERGTPAAYLLDETGHVAAPLASGAREVPALVQTLTSSS